MNKAFQWGTMSGSGEEQGRDRSGRSGEEQERDRSGRSGEEQERGVVSGLGKGAEYELILAGM